MQKLHRGYYNDAETGLYYVSSRYYDPEIGRFINADALVSTGQGLLGNNMFAYCNNSPVNRIDPTGSAYRELSAQINYCEYEHTYGGLRSVNPSGLLVEYNIPTGTLSICLCVTAAGGASVSSSQGVTFDWEGNIGHIKTIGAGAGFPSLGIALVITFTNADNIYLQRGLASQVGGSVNILGLSGGVDHAFFTNPETNEQYQGYSLVIGLDAAYLLEFHGGVTYSFVEGFNIFGFS